MTNVDELFDELVELGQYPKEKSDTVTVMEKIGHFWMMKYNGYSTGTNRTDCSNDEIQPPDRLKAWTSSG